MRLAGPFCPQGSSLGAVAFLIKAYLLSVSEAMHQWTSYVTTDLKFDSLRARVALAVENAMRYGTTWGAQMWRSSGEQ